MIDDKVTRISYEYAQRFEEINSHYLELMGKQIKAIGKLSPSNVNRLKEMARYSTNIAKINEELASASAITTKQLNALYKEMAETDYKYAKYLYDYMNVTQVAFEDNQELQAMLRAQSNLTAGTFQNMSNTTSISQPYIQAVDAAIQAVSTGVTDYYSEIRSALKAASVGARVTYASGLTRRLDSAARMNILEGIRQLNQETRKIMGDQFGNDGWEISTHGSCAKDHIKVQGRQYRNEDYQRMDSGLKRKIGKWNCRHIAFPIIMGVSEPNYSKEELEKIAAESTREVTINGKQYTVYEATQLMRQKETEMRYTKDLIILSRASGDTEKMRKAETRLRNEQEQYRGITSAAGLGTQYERAYVPGYKK